MLANLQSRRIHETSSESVQDVRSANQTSPLDTSEAIKKRIQQQGGLGSKRKTRMHDLSTLKAPIGRRYMSPSWCGLQEGLLMANSEVVCIGPTCLLVRIWIFEEQAATPAEAKPRAGIKAAPSAHCILQVTLRTPFDGFIRRELRTLMGTI